MPATPYIVRELIDGAVGLCPDNDNMAPGDRVWEWPTAAVWKVRRDKPARAEPAAPRLFLPARSWRSGAG